MHRKSSEVQLLTGGGTLGGIMLLPVVDKDQTSVDMAAGCSVTDTAECEQMEAWLDAHPDFAQDYFTRKYSRTVIFDSRASSPSSSPIFAGGLAGLALGLNNGPFEPPGSSSVGVISSSNSRASSGANTPVRKISAQEFERNGQILKPMIQTVDGIPSFLSAATSSAPGGGGGPGASDLTPGKLRRRRSELKMLDERELMYELIMDICNDLDVTRLCHKILQNVSLLLGADRCSLFLVQGTRGQPDCMLVSRLFDVGARTSLQDSTKMSQEIRVPWGKGIIGHVAMTGEGLNIPDAYEDKRFNKEVDKLTGYNTRSILCMPVNDFNGHVIGVAQAINKTSVRDEPFNEQDEKVFKSYLAFCGIGIHNAQMYERSTLENRRNQLLLDLAWVIFEEQSNVTNLIHKIMLHTQSLLRCERCQFLLVDEHNHSKFSRVFDIQASDFENDDSYHRAGHQEPRFPVNKGIVGHVSATGETLNIVDAYQDERFDSSVELGASFRSRGILCMPIKNAQGHVIGVAQLTNKLDNTPFNKNDENLFEAFAIFCGMGINNTRMYEKVVKTMARQRVTLEMLSYHSSASIDEVQRIKKLSLVPATQTLYQNLRDYQFSDFHLDDDDTLKVVCRMFNDLNLIEKFRISYDVFLRWLLTVKKNYRSVAYHNWRHAFNVTQTMFTMIESGCMKKVLSELEILALLVGSLSHDLDHRGTNNQFQIKTMSALSELYSTSTMERHHFDYCIMILNTKGNEIFANLDEESKGTVVRLLEEAILATDLALYFQHRGEFFRAVESNQLDWSQCSHRTLLRSMMMTACDLSAIAKPWPVQYKVANLLADEFFEQGDIEKSELHVKPIEMMDRDKKAQLPLMQISFIDSICMPIYEAFALVSVEFTPLLDGCRDNRAHWQELAENWSKIDLEKKDRENDEKDDIRNDDESSL